VCSSGMTMGVRGVVGEDMMCFAANGCMRCESDATTMVSFFFILCDLAQPQKGFWLCGHRTSSHLDVPTANHVFRSFVVRRTAVSEGGFGRSAAKA